MNSSNSPTMRQLIEIVQRYNDENNTIVSEFGKTLTDIISLGDGFENKGAILRHKETDQTFYIGADVDEDTLNRILAQKTNANDVYHKLDFLVEHKILVKC